MPEKLKIERIVCTKVIGILDKFNDELICQGWDHSPQNYILFDERAE